MPQVFKVGSYLVYFWSNEGSVLEPVHVHVSEGEPTAFATKIWITSEGRALLCSNQSEIPKKQLSIIMRLIEARREDIEKKWVEHFGMLVHYC